MKNSIYSERQESDSNRLYAEIQNFPAEKRGSAVEMAITFIRGMQAQERLAARQRQESA